MKKVFFIGAVFCIFTAILVLLYQGLSARSAVEDPIKLEDAIIIDGIQMDSDTPPDDDEDGQIIFNDDFDDSIADFDAQKKQKGESAAPQKTMKDFNSLKAKDRRWHLNSYRIKKNDNIWKIAKRFGIHQHLIISVNGINNPGMLKPGRSIKIPSRNGIYYNVRKGDTVTKIASRYKIPGKAIIGHNRLKNGQLRQGQSIFLPDAREQVPVHIAARKKKGPISIASDFRFIWPVRGRITSGFGNRKDPLYGQRQFHCGIDISANVGTPVRASSDGRIIFSGWKPGYGNCVIARHEGGYISVYAHNSKNLAVSEGTVKQGDIIAYSGMTGAVTGAHVHFELRKYVNPLNPLRFLK